MKPEMIVVYNVNVPGAVSRVQKDKYDEVKRVLYEKMPASAPGMTQSEMMQIVTENVSESVFDDKSKAGWWMKTVQLDLEAKQVMVRENSKPTRWYLLKTKEEIIPSQPVPREQKPKEKHEMTEEIKNILLENGVLKQYNERPGYQKNDYLGWIYQAKRPDTKKKRIDIMIQELKDGNRYMNMEYKGTKS